MSWTTIGRRQFLTLLTASGAAVSLAACGATVAAPGAPQPTVAPAANAAASKPTTAGASAPTTAAAPGTAVKPATATVTGKQTIHVWTWTSVENMPAWQAAADGFKARYPDTTAELLHIPGGEYWDKLTVSYAGGESPDVVYLPPDPAHSTGAKGMLLDLTPWVQRDKFNLEDITPVTQVPYMWGGKIYAINAMNDTTFIAYNQTLFRAAGVQDLPQEWDGNFTTENFVDIAKKLTDEKKQQWGYFGSGRDYHWIFDFGGKFWDDEKYPTKSVVDSPEAVAGLQFLQDLIYKHRVTPPPAALSGLGSGDDVFKTGKVGMVQARNKNLTGIFKPIKGFNYSATTFPKEPNHDRRTDAGINAFGTVSKSKVPDQSWTYVKWMTAEDGNAKLLGLTSLPANKNVDPYTVSPLEKWQVKLTLDGLKNAYITAPHPNIRPQMFQAMDEEMDLLLNNKKNAQETGAAMAKRVNDLFAQLGPAVPK